MCLGLFALSAFAISAVATRESGKSNCESPEFRQFDFWVGDWDVSDVQGRSVVARVRVRSILNGCALLEEYRNSAGFEGQSVSAYDAVRQVWHQNWVTNRGQLLTIEGRWVEGAMELSGSDRLPDGTERQVRGTWRVTREGVRESAMRSTDGGQQWTPWFDLIFRPHKK